MSFTFQVVSMRCDACGREHHFQRLEIPEDWLVDYTESMVAVTLCPNCKTLDACKTSPHRAKVPICNVIGPKPTRHAVGPIPVGFIGRVCQWMDTKIEFRLYPKI